MAESVLTNNQILQGLAKSAVAGLKATWTINEQNWVPVNLTTKQRLFLDLPHLEVLYGGAAGGGKTTAIAAGALQYVDRPGYHSLLLRRTFADLSKPGSLMDVLHSWLHGTGAKWNDQKKQWKFPATGSIIQFGYIEQNNDKYRYKSDEYHSIFFDELTSFDEEPYVYLMSRLRRRKGSDIPLRMRAGTNPGDIGAVWCKARFVPEDFSVDRARQSQFVEKIGMDGQGNPVVRAFVPALLSDNPGLDAEGYLTSLNQLDPVSREQLLKGDWNIAVKGDVYPEWDEKYHVIGWDEFERVVGCRRIPENWLIGIGMDWGSTESHPYVVSFVARAPESSPLAGKTFLYKSLSGYAEPPRQVAMKIWDTLNEHKEFDRCYVWLMSHEAKSVRDTMVMEHGLPFGAWKPDRTAGIAQVRDFLQIRGEMPDSFHPQLQGSPSLYLVVDDDERAFPRTDLGLARHRMEFPLYHYTEAGIPENRKLNDAMDSLRGIMAVFGPPIAPLTEEERLQKRIKDFQLDAPLRTMDEYDKVIWEMSRQSHIKEIIEDEKSKNRLNHPMDQWKREILND